MLTATRDTLLTDLDRFLAEKHATRQDIDLEDLTIDPRYQSRVGLVPENVSKLSDILKETGFLSPIAVARQENPDVAFTYNYTLAAGFHRCEAYQKLKRESIPAWIFDGSEEDIVRVSVLSNRYHCWPTSKTDQKKAVEMLFRNEETFTYSDSSIASMVSLNANTVSSLRKVYCQKHGIAMPRKFTNISGGVYVRPDSDYRSMYQETESGRFRSQVGGKQVSLGKDRAKASERLRKIMEERPLPLPMPGVRWMSIPIDENDPKRAADKILAECGPEWVKKLIRCLKEGL